MTFVRFLDTNIFIRHLANDHPVQSPACLRLIREIEQGLVSAWTSNLVVAEVVFVLSSNSFYNLDRATIRGLILPLINLPGISLPNKHLYAAAFDLYVQLKIDYTDAYNAAIMLHRDNLEIYSYDRHFNRVPGITRLEP